MFEILTKSPNRTQPVVRRVVSDSYALSPRSAIARCLRSMGESAMGESLSETRLGEVLKLRQTEYFFARNALDFQL